MSAWFCRPCSKDDGVLTRYSWHIVSTEAVRLWQFWVGLPVSPRQWKIEFPDVNRDEL